MKKGMLLSALAASVMLSVAGCSGSGDGGGSKFTLTSTSFKDGAAIPKKYAYDGVPSNGSNISPQLAWKNAPDETDKFLLIVDDPDAKPIAGHTWLHWLAGIDGEDTSLDEGASKTHAFLVQGKNSYDKQGYGGPNPPVGSGTHHYRFCLYALDNITLSDAMIAKMKTQETTKTTLGAHILETACLTGTYENPSSGGAGTGGSGNGGAGTGGSGNGDAGTGGSGNGGSGNGGSGNNTTPQSIVGTWHQDCHHSQIRDLSMRSDGTGTLTKKNYTDTVCTQGEQVENHNFSYTKGGDTTGSQGESATELDISFGSGNTDNFYTMYRFMDNGNLLLADKSNEKDGSTREKREDFFDPNDPGFVRQ